MSSISAAILAGGRAARLGGADKASLVVGGRRIVDRQLALLTALSDDIRIVTSDPARYADVGVRVVADTIAGAGPLGGLYTALVDARHQRLLVVACDLPFLSPALLERLVAESETDEERDAVVPRSGRGLEPLVALYRTRCAAAAREGIERGDLRMTALLARLRVREVDANTVAGSNEETLFENVNTPHDYARARDRAEPDGKPSENRITE
jgi:molybdopterin-guanine dinucleotide biosynthesis protein A